MSFCAFATWSDQLIYSEHAGTGCSITSKQAHSLAHWLQRYVSHREGPWNLHEKSISLSSLSFFRNRSAVFWLH